MENYVGESGDPAASGDMRHARRVSTVFSQGSVTCGRQLCAVLQRLSAIESSTKSGDGMGVVLGLCSPQEGFFLRRSHVRSHQDNPLQASRDTNVRRWRPNTSREGGFCFASADTLKGSGGSVVVSSSNTSREGGSRFFLASVDTSRESGSWQWVSFHSLFI